MTMNDIIEDDLSDTEIAERLAALRDSYSADPAVRSAAEQAREALQDHRLEGTEHRFFRPLSDAADEYIGWAQNPGERIYTGIGDFDRAMRGVAPGEMALVVGYTHSGKTVLTTELILHNRKRRIAMFTPDETRVLVLIKLACIVHDVSAYDLERDVANNDPSAIELVRSTATQHFPNLAVFDDGLDLPHMRQALREARSWWGDREDMVVYDYADLLQGAGEDTSVKISALKSWGKGDRFPLWLLHQSSRTSGSDGKKVKIDSGGYGGEQQATFVIGVRRKKYELISKIDELRDKIETQANPSAALTEKLTDCLYEMKKHENTITFNLVKNKRPPSPLVDDLDYVIDERTGRVKPFTVDRPMNAHAAVAARNGRQHSFDDGEDF